MAKNMFLIKGNICAERVRLGRALHKPPLKQEELATKIQLMGMEMTQPIISRIEKKAIEKLREEDKKREFFIE